MYGEMIFDDGLGSDVSLLGQCLAGTYNTTKLRYSALST
jgi:hypothetical protein